MVMFFIFGKLFFGTSLWALHGPSVAGVIDCAYDNQIPTKESKHWCGNCNHCDYFNFNETTRELVLSVGNLSSYLPSKIFAFQVKITPDTLPTTVIGKAKLTGKDAWTYKVFEIEVPSLDSNQISDLNP